jgi:hypothetical protein
MSSSSATHGGRGHSGLQECLPTGRVAAGEAYGERLGMNAKRRRPPGDPWNPGVGATRSGAFVVGLALCAIALVVVIVIVKVLGLA